jgi:hypothetical protein
MGKFIEEFYYGNLDPQARSTKENKTVQKQMGVLMLNEHFLTENLSGESKRKFLDFCNAWGVVNGESISQRSFKRSPVRVKTPPLLLCWKFLFVYDIINTIEENLAEIL